MNRTNKRIRNVIALIGIITIIVSLIIWVNDPTFNGDKVWLEHVKSNEIDSIRPISDKLIYPIVYENIPDLSKRNKEIKVSTFLDIMIPSILLAQEKLKLKQDSIVLLIEKDIDRNLNNEDSIFILKIKKEYRTDSLAYIAECLNTHPISITLAQAAIESGWGTSRFCIEANNVFGIWSYNTKENRIQASISRDGNPIYLRKYNSVFESAYNYLETISRVPAYKQFRKARNVSNNPYQLIWHLSKYSEKGYEYVQMLRDIIEYNELTKYDNCQLIPYYIRD